MFSSRSKRNYFIFGRVVNLFFGLLFPCFLILFEYSINNFFVDELSGEFDPLAHFGCKDAIEFFAHFRQINSAVLRVSAGHDKSLVEVLLLVYGEEADGSVESSRGQDEIVLSEVECTFVKHYCY